MGFGFFCGGCVTNGIMYPPPPHAQCSWPKGMRLFQTKRPGYWSETWCRKGATLCLRVYRCLNIMNISTLWLRYWQIAYRNDLRPLNPDLCFFRFLGWNLMRVLTWNRLFGWLWSPGHRVWWEWRHFPGPGPDFRDPGPQSKIPGSALQCKPTI